MRRFYLLAVLLASMLALPTTPTHAAGADGAKKMTGTIGDFVWRDQNANGVQDAGEPGLADVYVELQNASGGWVNAVFTNANGAYSFTGVAPGTYKIKFANPGGFFQSPTDAGGNDATDNDADINGFTANFSVAAGQVISNIDGGFKPQNASTCSLTLSGAAGTKTCNDNGTPNNASDDVYTFEFTGTIVSNPNNLPIWGYKVQINNTTVYGMYGMPITIGPLPISAGTLTWTLVDDDNPTCTATGTVTPPNTCSNGGNCATSAVRTISNTPIVCGQPANMYGFWFNNLNVNLSREWLWESGQMVENSNGTANIIGVIFNKTKVNAKFAVDIVLSGRTFSTPSGSPKIDDACAGTATGDWYYYNSVTGNLTGINSPSANELAGGSIMFSAFGPKAQFGTGGSLRNASANGGSSWLNYSIVMQPVNTSLQFSANPAGAQGADFNFQVSGSPLTNCAATGVLTLNCTNNITVTAAVGASSAVVNYTAPTATSTCTVGSVSVVKTSGLASGSAFPVGTSSVVYTATDGCGNVKTCTFTVTVNGGTPVCDDVLTPGSIAGDEMGCPPFDPAGITQLTAPTGGSGALEYVWLSSTSGCPTASSQQIPGATGATFDPGVISATTWYVRCVRRVGCTSYTGPTHESNCVKKEVKTTGCNTGSPCDAVTITPGSGNIAICGLPSFSAVPVMMIQVFNASWAQVFAQNYTTNPQPSCVTIPALAAGVYYVKVNLLNASWVQICQKDGYFTVGGGNPSVLTLNCTNNITVTAAQGANTAVVNYTAPTATSTCTTGSVSVVKTSGLASGSAFPVGTSSVVYTATDGCGNVKTCTFTVTVNGAAASVLTLNCTNNITVTAAAGASSAVVNYTAPTATSTCTTGSVSVVKTSGLASGSAFPVGTSSVVYTATDGCGNVKTCTFTVTVNPGGNVCDDVTSGGTIGADQLECPPYDPTNITELSAPTGGSGAFEYIWLSSTAGCPNDISQQIPGATGISYDPGSISQTTWYRRCVRRAGCTSYVGNNHESNCVKKEVKTTGCNTGSPCDAVTITPGSGNIAICGLPSFSAVPVMMIQVFNASWAQVFSQNYTTNPQPSCVTIPSLAAGVYYVKVNLLNASWVQICQKDGYFTVGGGNTGVLTLNCTNNITVTAAQGATSAVVNYSAPTATSTCTTGSVSVVKTSGLASGSAFPVGTSSVVYTATDGCGNVKTCTFTVTVNASAASVLTFNCTNNITVTAAVGANTAVVNYTAPTATSTCTTGSVSVVKTSGLASGSAFPVGVSTVVYTATDGCGNVKTCTFTVTVNAAVDPCATETTPPTISGCPGNQTVTAAAKYTATNTDKCGTAGTYGMWFDFVDQSLNHFSLSNAMFLENANGSATLTGTATSEGNANLKFNVNITWTGRVTAPPAGSPKTLDCTAQVSTYGNNVRFYTGMSGTLTGSGTASNGVTFTLTRRGPSFQVGNGANLRTTGLGASCWFTMTRTGNNAGCPAVTEGDFNFNIASTPNTATATWTAPTATDNCSTPTLTTNFTPGSAFPVGATLVSYTATDARNNKSTCSFTITVNQVNPGGGFPGSGSMVDPAKCYYIVNKSSGKVIDAEDHGAGSGYVSQFVIDNTSSEKWKFQDAGAGYFYIVSQYTGSVGKVLDIAGGSTANGAFVDVVNASGQDCTKFCFQDAGNGFVYIVAKHSGKAIKLVSNPGVDGTQIFQQPISSGNEHQKWSLLEVSCTGAHLAPSQTLTFNAFRKGLNSELKWINNTGDKNEFFDIERSTDGDNFTKIGRVDGKGPEHSGGDQLYFQSFDRNPALGDNIYRLKMVWKDGTVSYSNEQTVRFESLPALGIYPNPAVDELFIDLSQFVGEKVELNIVNNLGVQVFDETIQKATDEAHRIDISEIHSGSYRLLIQSENNRPEVRQVIVEKF